MVPNKNFLHFILTELKSLDYFTTVTLQKNLRVFCLEEFMLLHKNMKCLCKRINCIC